jgi:hypothetical protein
MDYTYLVFDDNEQFDVKSTAIWNLQGEIIRCNIESMGYITNNIYKVNNISYKTYNKVVQIKDPYY